MTITLGAHWILIAIGALLIAAPFIKNEWSNGWAPGPSELLALGCFPAGLVFLIWAGIHWWFS